MSRNKQKIYGTPLRYPGGKSKLTPFMEYLFTSRGIENGTYVEPFAGGAGIAINLLLKGVVGNIIINDYDKAIASFWNAVVKENERLIKRIKETDVTMEEWYAQRNILMNAKSCSFDLGFATFFLNRTNRSGILNGGPIGGYEQSGTWKLDARYNKEKLIDRIKAIGKHKNKIKVYNQDVRRFIDNYIPAMDKNMIIYYDPPYYCKGEELYLNFFTREDHQEIEKMMRTRQNANWIMTYDSTPEIANMYKDYCVRKYSLYYCAAKKRKASELLITPKKMVLPDAKQLSTLGMCVDFE